MEKTMLNLVSLFKAGLGDSFVRLFTEMTALVIVLFVLGILLCVIELFSPGFGIFGISGIALIVIAIIIRMTGGGDIYMLAYMFLFSLIFLGILFGVISRSMKKGALSKAKMFDVGTAVPTGITEGTKDFSALIGATGVTTTVLRPVGKASFGGVVHDVMAHDGFIEEGAKIEVTGVEGQRIVVQLLNKKKEKVR